MQPEQIIMAPIVTEKAVAERALSRYVFKVNWLANKAMIGEAVSKLFKVTVTKVNTSKVRSKRRVMGKSVGRTARWKKAYVTLKSGQKIEELES
jgi:large subunit ribosomal protein L23